MTYIETDLVASIESLAGSDLTTLTQEQWDGLDQFHSGGAEAVDRIRPGLQLAPGLTALDIGSGFGGPARQIARATGSRVIGIDITPAYVEAARALTDKAGLSEQVEFVCSDIATFEHTGFDAAYTMHVQMNVADKKSFFTEIARRLRPGARFATFEICSSGDAKPSPPLPWTLDGSDSFLVTAAQLRDTIEAGGFETLEWVDETAWVRQWFEAAPARLAAGGTRATLPAVLADGPTRIRNLALALGAGVLSVHRGAFRVTRP